MACDASVVLSSLQAKAMQTNDREELGSALVQKLREALPRATWVGIHWLEGEDLVLGPYVGQPTEHRRIPVGTGVCGTAVAENRDQIIEDVRAVENYLPISTSVRSEIVVLVRSMGKVIGSLALDSPEVGAFGAVDQCILRAVADSFGGLVASSSNAAS